MDPLLSLLQGLAVGNGLTHPVQQYGAYADFALLNNLITPQQHKMLHKAYLPCKLAAKSCGECPHGLHKVSPANASSTGELSSPSPTTSISLLAAVAMSR